MRRIPCTSWREAREIARNFAFPALIAGNDIHTVWVFAWLTYNARRDWMYDNGSSLDVIPEDSNE